MGRRISGVPSCASIAPSQNSTSECTIDCRWMTAVTLSSGRSYRCIASMISSPLFISVAESTVIFAPMLQFGCRSASARVLPASSPRVRPKNGPPEQVRMSRLISPRSRQPIRHWKMAECSESTGMISARYRAAARITSSPAHTSVSLFASAMRFFARMAQSVGRRPIMPDTAVTTVSASGSAAAASRPSMPLRTVIFISASRAFNSCAAASSYKTASSGQNSRHCAASASTSVFAVSAATRTPSVCATSSVCRPIDPVEPRTEMQRLI